MIIASAINCAFTVIIAVSEYTVNGAHEFVPCVDFTYDFHTPGPRIGVVIVPGTTIPFTLSTPDGLIICCSCVYGTQLLFPNANVKLAAVFSH